VEEKVARKYREDEVMLRFLSNLFPSSSQQQQQEKLAKRFFILEQRKKELLWITTENNSKYYKIIQYPKFWSGLTEKIASEPEERWSVV